MATNYQHVIEDVIDRTLDQATGGENAEYSVSPAVIIMTNPQGQPQPTMVYLLTISIPSLSMGEVLTSPATIPSSRPTEDQVAEATRTLVENLVEERDRQARETISDAPVHNHSHGAHDLSGLLPRR